MESKWNENLGKCVKNKADYVPVINNTTEGTSQEEGDVGGSSTGTGGMCIFRVYCLNIRRYASA